MTFNRKAGAGRLKPAFLFPVYYDTDRLSRTTDRLALMEEGKSGTFTCDIIQSKRKRNYVALAAFLDRLQERTIS